ncbi:MAG: DUF2271 domain-containing protein [Bacteroidota bacterium]
MKKIFTLNLLKSAIAVCIIALSTQAFAVKTPGLLTFSVTTQGFTCGPCETGNEAGHVIAIWIENSSNAFVKTKLKYAVNQISDLTLWNLKSGGNTTDATTGATLYDNGARSITWNGTDVSGTLVDDGNYTLWVEIAWDSDGLSTSSISIPFVKGTSVDSKTPTATTYFTSMTLTWTPSTVGINDNNMNVSIFPNPTTDKLNLELGDNKADTKIQLINAIGVEVYAESFTQLSGIKSIDLNKFAEGVYFVKVQRNNQNFNYKLVVN